MISSVWSCEIISMILLVHSASFEKSVSRQNNHYIFFSVCPKKLLYFWFTLRIDKVWQYNNEKYQQNKKKNLSKYSTSESSFYPKMERIKVSFLPTFLCIFCAITNMCVLDWKLKKDHHFSTSIVGVLSKITFLKQK